MKLKKVQKGFTLVEILVAIALFSATCAVLFGAIVFAINNNKENHYAGEEIQMQMNSAENYNNKQTLFDNKVAAHRFSGSNKVQLKVDFSKTTDGTSTGNTFSFSNDNVYAYQANAGYEDRYATYHMRFFDPEKADLYDPASKKWWVRFHNYSTVNVGREVYINPSNGVRIYGSDGKSHGTHFSNLDLFDSTGAVSYQFGLDLSSALLSPGDSIMFVGDWYNDFYNDPTYKSTMDSTREYEFTVDNIDKFKEIVEDDETGVEEPSGYIDVYYDGTGIYSKSEFDAIHVAS